VSRIDVIGQHREAVDRRYRQDAAHPAWLRNFLHRDDPSDFSQPEAGLIDI
jgi:hypothetical protein